MSDWNVLYTELTNQHDYIRPNPSATQKQILDVEKALGNKLPADLKELLLEMNGDRWLVFSTEQIIETNLSARKLIFLCLLTACCFLVATVAAITMDIQLQTKTE